MEMRAIQRGGVRRRLNRYRVGRAVAEILKHVGLLTILFLLFTPIVVMLILSLKDNPQIAHSLPWEVTTPLRWENYGECVGIVMRYIENTIKVVGLAVLGIVCIASFTAYVFARFQFPGRDLLFYLIISLMMVPGIVSLIPRFLIVKDLGLVNTHWGLIIPYISGGQVFGIFLLRQFFRGVPKELFEASEIDGAGDIAAFWHVAIPLCLPIIGTLVIMNVVGLWNDLVWPTICLDNNQLYTVTRGLMLFHDTMGSSWGFLLAGYVIAAWPLVIVFAFMSRLFIRGLTSGALKL